MTVRLPSSPSLSPGEAQFDALGHEILAEKAASLGRAGALAELALQRLKAFEGEGDGDADRRRALLKDAADAVYAYFIQRELCGFRRHDAIIREFGIPKSVLARLGGR